jgi:hypothetical protein
MIKRSQINAKSSQWIAAHVAVFRFDKNEKNIFLYFIFGKLAASKSSKVIFKNSKTSWN